VSDGCRTGVRRVSDPRYNCARGWRELTGRAAPNTRVIVARAECDYRAPAFFGEELEVRLWVGELGRSSFGLTTRSRRWKPAAWWRQERW
jgi:acyl-CoA thioesterase FadM